MYVSGHGTSRRENVSMLIIIYKHVSMIIHACMYVHLHLHVHVHVHAHVHVHVHVCAFASVYLRIGITM